MRRKAIKRNAEKRLRKKNDRNIECNKEKQRKKRTKNFAIAILGKFCGT